jgi:hypothetical protein
VGPYRRGVQRPRDAERPRERRAPLGTVQALRGEVQPCTAPGEPAPRVRGDYPVHRDDPQQTVGHIPTPATDACPDGSRDGSLIRCGRRSCGGRTRLVGRCGV